MHFIETRGNNGQLADTVTFSDAILSPIASHGGIYSPAAFPELTHEFLQQHVNAGYETLAMSILSLFDIDIDTEVLADSLALYRQFDNAENPVPVVKVRDTLYVSELYHGPTRAFKDMALQPFGSILSSLAKQKKQKYLILAATSGDTGPAALETFRNRENIQVVCLYPSGGTSDVQRLQMVTESASNLKVIGIQGNFDDAQKALKALLGSASFKEQLEISGISLSAANSVNFGRIIFQIMYHVYAYLALVQQGKLSLGDNIYLNIPSGNFGNALGAYYAKKMGLPIEKIIISSNSNNVLTEWINTGKYDISNKALIQTTSPAMDILKSSNVERVLFDLFGAKRTRALMQQLDEQGGYQLEASELAQLQAVFIADYCTDAQTNEEIKDAFQQGYLVDPHTATCFKTQKSLSLKPIPSIIFSTAEWTKFSPVIDQAINNNPVLADQQALDSIAKTAGISIPDTIASLFSKPIVHQDVINKSAIESTILDFLKT